MRLPVLRWLAVVVGLCQCLSNPAVAAVERPSSEKPALNVTIPVFNPGVPEDPSQLRDLRVFPRIRQVESKMMPFLLRETLVKTGHWGAVRVATKMEPAAELQLLVTILRSDGDTLELQVKAIDATGDVWFDEAFSGTADDSVGARSREAPFWALYADIATALQAAASALDAQTLSRIQSTSLMRYARELAPSAFGEFVEQTDDGAWRVLRLPARNDPMYQRIHTIRETEFLISDTVDAKYRDLNSQLARTYRVWRDYRRKLVEYEAGNLRFANAKPDPDDRGSWESIKHQYDSFKYDRITAQEQDRLAVAFNNEVSSTIDAMEARVAELDGWVEQGYLEWRSLLEDLFEVEQYLLEQPGSLSQ